MGETLRASALAALFFLFGGCNAPVYRESIDPNEDWPARHPIFVYGTPPLDYLDAVGGTALAWSIFFSGPNREEAAYLRAVHASGRRVSSNFPTMQGSTRVVDDPGLLARSACATFDEAPARALWIQPEEPYLPCHNNPEWQDFLAQRAREHAGAGSDAVDIDEIEGIGGHLYTAGWCRWCMEGFRRHLARSYSTTELADRFGISEIGSFDYHADLVARGGGALADDPRPELRREFVRFELLSRVRQIRDLEAGARAVSPRIRFTGNTVGLFPQYVVYTPLLDFLVYEGLLAPPPLAENAPTHKLARALVPGGVSSLFPNIINLLGFLGGKFDLFLQWYAEAVACGERMLLPFEAYTYGGKGTVTIPAETVGPYTRFFRDDPPTGATPLADVGLVYPFRQVLEEYLDSGYQTPWAAAEPTHLAFEETARTLREAHIPYDVIVAGDGTFLPDAPPARTYRALLFPTPESEASPGHLLDGFSGLSSSDPEEIRSIPTPVVSTTASGLLGVFPWSSTGEVVVYLVNYDFDGSRFVAAPPESLAIAWPPGLDPPRSALFETPEGVRREVPVTFDPAAGRATIPVPSIGIAARLRIRG